VGKCDQIKDAITHGIERIIKGGEDPPTWEDKGEDK
jgi:hypothetical protein